MLNFIKIYLNKFTLINLSKYLGNQLYELSIFFKMVSRKKLTYLQLINLLLTYNNNLFYIIIISILKVSIGLMTLPCIILLFDIIISDYNLLYLNYIISYYNFITNTFKDYFQLILDEFKIYHKLNLTELTEVKEPSLIENDYDNEKKHLTSENEKLKVLDDLLIEDDNTKNFWNNPYIK